MNKAKIIAELENMVIARLFSRQPLLTDPETCSAVNRKHIQIGLVEVVCVETQTWRSSPLGKGLDMSCSNIVRAKNNALDHEEHDEQKCRVGRPSPGRRRKSPPTITKKPTRQAGALF
jgi:hypothetical protein